MSERFNGSPPVRMKIDGFRLATSRISFSASRVVSSSGWRLDCAQARQWQHARSHACVVSQITSNGQRLRSKLVFMTQPHQASLNQHCEKLILESWLHLRCDEDHTSLPAVLTFVLESVLEKCTQIAAKSGSLPCQKKIYGFS